MRLLPRIPGAVMRLRFPQLAAALVLCGCSASDESAADYPQRPIKVVVPFEAGGGSDTFSRIVQQGIEEQQLLSQPLVIINVPGAGGTIGSRRVRHARPDGYTILQLHEGILTSKYAGRVSYGPEAFEPIAGTGEAYMVIAVAEEAEYRSLNEMLTAARDRPDELIFSANIGAPSHFAGLMLEKTAPGSRFRYVQTGDGGKRFAGLKGGHADVSAFSMAEYMQFKSAGLRAVAVLAEQRHPEAAGVPTAREQGFDVVSTNMHFWWAPRETPPERIAVIAQVLEQAMKGEPVRSRLSQLQTDPVFLAGDALRDALADRTKRIAAVSQRPTTPLPNFPGWVFAGVLVLGAFVVLQSLTRAGRTQSPSPALAHSPAAGSVRSAGGSRPMLAGICLGLTGLYVLAMQLELSGFRMATFLYVTIIGLLLAENRGRAWPAVVSMALLMSAGLHFVFTQVFVIDLP
jgi:putative tricarboxylic transport membrane protein